MTRSVMDAALEAGVARVVYTSTLVAVGERQGEVGTEETVHRGYFLGEYQRTKTVAEREALARCERGLPLVCVNPAAVYGPGDPKPTGRTVVDAANGALPGWFAKELTLVYVDDVVHGHLLAAEKGKIGERYILAGDVVSLKQVIDIVNGYFGGKAPPHLP